MRYKIGKIYIHKISDTPIYDIETGSIISSLFCNEPFVLLKSYDDFFDSFEVLTKDSVIGRIILTKIYLVEK